MKNKIIVCVSLIVLVIALVVVAIVNNNGVKKDKKDPLDDVETVASIVENGYKLDIKSEQRGVEKSTDDQMYIITVDKKEYIGEKEERVEDANVTDVPDYEDDTRDYWDSLYTVVYKNIFTHSASDDFSNVNTWDTIGINNKKYKYSLVGDKAELVYEINDKSYMLIEVNFISKVKYNKDGNILEKDVTDLTEDILKSEEIGKAIRFKLKEYNPETDKVENKNEVKPEEKSEVKESNETK